eukprot:403376326
MNAIKHSSIKRSGHDRKLFATNHGQTPKSSKPSELQSNQNNYQSALQNLEINDKSRQVKGEDLINQIQQMREKLIDTRQIEKQSDYDKEAHSVRKSRVKKRTKVSNSKKQQNSSTTNNSNNCQQIGINYHQFQNPQSFSVSHSKQTSAFTAQNFSTSFKSQQDPNLTLKYQNFQNFNSYFKNFKTSQNFNPQSTIAPNQQNITGYNQPDKKQIKQEFFAKIQAQSQEIQNLKAFGKNNFMQEESKDIHQSPLRITRGSLLQNSSQRLIESDSKKSQESNITHRRKTQELMSGVKPLMYTNKYGIISADRDQYSKLGGTEEINFKTANHSEEKLQRLRSAKSHKRNASDTYFKQPMIQKKIEENLISYDQGIDFKQEIAFTIMGKYQFIMKNFQDALMYSNKALEIIKLKLNQCNDLEIQTKEELIMNQLICMIVINKTHKKMKNISQAFVIFEEAKDLCRRTFGLKVDFSILQQTYQEGQRVFQNNMITSRNPLETQNTLQSNIEAQMEQKQKVTINISPDQNGQANIQFYDSNIFLVDTQTEPKSIRISLKGNNESVLGNLRKQVHSKRVLANDAQVQNNQVDSASAVQNNEEDKFQEELDDTVFESPNQQAPNNFEIDLELDQESQNNQSIVITKSQDLFYESDNERPNHIQPRSGRPSNLNLEYRPTSINQIDSQLRNMNQQPTFSREEVKEQQQPSIHSQDNIENLNNPQIVESLSSIAQNQDHQSSNLDQSGFVDVYTSYPENQIEAPNQMKNIDQVQESQNNQRNNSNQALSQNKIKIRCSRKQKQARLQQRMKKKGFSSSVRKSQKEISDPIELDDAKNDQNILERLVYEGNIDSLDIKNNCEHNNVKVTYIANKELFQYTLLNIIDKSIQFEVKVTLSKVREYYQQKLKIKSNINLEDLLTFVKTDFAKLAYLDIPDYQELIVKILNHKQVDLISDSPIVFKSENQSNQKINSLSFTLAQVSKPQVEKKPVPQIQQNDQIFFDNQQITQNLLVINDTEQKSFEMKQNIQNSQLKQNETNQQTSQNNNLAINEFLDLDKLLLSQNTQQLNKEVNSVSSTDSQIQSLQNDKIEVLQERQISPLLNQNIQNSIIQEVIDEDEDLSDLIYKDTVKQISPGQALVQFNQIDYEKLKAATQMYQQDSQQPDNPLIIEGIPKKSIETAIIESINEKITVQQNIEDRGKSYKRELSLDNTIGINLQRKRNTSTTQSDSQNPSLIPEKSHLSQTDLTYQNSLNVLSTLNEYSAVKRQLSEQQPLTKKVTQNQPQLYSNENVEKIKQKAIKVNFSMKLRRAVIERMKEIMAEPREVKHTIERKVNGVDYIKRLIYEGGKYKIEFENIKTKALTSHPLTYQNRVYFTQSKVKLEDILNHVTLDAQQKMVITYQFPDNVVRDKQLRLLNMGIMAFQAIQNKKSPDDSVLVLEIKRSVINNPMISNDVKEKMHKFKEKQSVIYKLRKLQQKGRNMLQVKGQNTQNSIEIAPLDNKIITIHSWRKSSKNRQYLLRAKFNNETQEIIIDSLCHTLRPLPTNLLDLMVYTTYIHRPNILKEERDQYWIEYCLDFLKLVLPQIIVLDFNNYQICLIKINTHQASLKQATFKESQQNRITRQSNLSPVEEEEELKIKFESSDLSLVPPRNQLSQLPSLTSPITDNQQIYNFMNSSLQFQQQLSDIKETSEKSKTTPTQSPQSYKTNNFVETKTKVSFPILIQHQTTLQNSQANLVLEFCISQNLEMTCSLINFENNQVYLNDRIIKYIKDPEQEKQGFQLSAGDLIDLTEIYQKIIPLKCATIKDAVKYLKGKMRVCMKHKKQ